MSAITPLLPTGTVTFLYTDIEGSTKRWETNPAAMKAAVERHDTLLRQAIEENGGVVFRTAGDAFSAAFPTAPGALAAAVDAQRALCEEFKVPGSRFKVEDPGSSFKVGSNNLEPGT